MPLKLIKIMLAGVLAGHLLKANRIRSTARFSRAGWAMFFTTAKFFWLVFQRLSFSGWCLSMHGKERKSLIKNKELIYVNWENLLSAERLQNEERTEPTTWEKYNISEFEKDYKQVISSAAFRRLQDKTQVFPLDKSDFVRTRLTHSLEVSMIGKQLCTMIKTYINSNKERYRGFNENVSVNCSEILMCAGLIHDLGNPPFGHFGEVVIGEWFKNKFNDSNFKYKDRSISDILDEQMKQDLIHFEGNAQSIRLLLKADYGICEHNNNSLNLTKAVIHTLLKYPVSSLTFNKQSDDIKVHKNGYFKSEQDKIWAISSELGTDYNNEIKRHPLTFLLEAADDIAYATADLEDAFRKGLFTIDEFVEFFDEKLRDLEKDDVKAPEQAKDLIKPLRDLVGNTNRNEQKDSEKFNEWVKYARGWLMYCVAYSFTHNYKYIMNGTYAKDLFADTFHEFSIKILKDAMGKFVYNNDSIIKLELSAQTIISFLLNEFVTAVLYLDETDKQTGIDKRLINLISENYKNDYNGAKDSDDEAYNLYLRFLLVTDFISGMTDSYAKNLYQELNGIN